MKYSSLVPRLHEGKAQALQETPERLKLASTSWSQSRSLSSALPSFGNADSTIYTLLWGVGTPVDCQWSILSTYTVYSLLSWRSRLSNYHALKH